MNRTGIRSSCGTTRERQRAQLPDAVRSLVLEDQRLRSGICRHAFDD